jgi:hypothetical protein
VGWVVGGSEHWEEDCVVGEATGQRGELGRWEARDSPVEAAMGVSETVAAVVVAVEALVGAR